MHPYQHPYQHIPICTCTENINAGSVCFAFSWGWVACSFVFYVLYYSIDTLLRTADICYTSWVLHTYTHTCMLLNFIPNVLNENFIVRKLLWKVLLVLWLTSLEKHCSNSHGATLFSIFLKCIWFMHKFVFFVFYMLSLIKTTVCCNMIDVTCHG